MTYEQIQELLDKHQREVNANYEEIKSTHEKYIEEGKVLLDFLRDRQAPKHITEAEKFLFVQETLMLQGIAIKIYEDAIEQLEEIEVLKENEVKKLQLKIHLALGEHHVKEIKELIVAAKSTIEVVTISNNQKIDSANNSQIGSIENVRDNRENNKQ